MAEQGGFQEIFSSFAVPGEFVEAREVTRGHIHRTWITAWSGGKRLVHQRLNHHVFRDVPAVMRNMILVLSCLRGERLTIVPAAGGGSFAVDSDGNYWRAFKYIEDTACFDVCTGPEMAYDAAKKFGEFQVDLRSLEEGALTDPIPRFMDCESRLADLLIASRDDTHSRRTDVEPEIRFAEDRRQLFALLGSSQDPGHQKRPTHGDMKLNNLLFSASTGKPRCVIDLDTCMNGSYLFDFGDMVRVGCASGREDEPDPRAVGIREDLFEGIVSGYAESMGAHLTKYEREHLVTSSIVLALTVGTRFLTDYLRGDRYFRVEYPEHNLVRARAQFALARRLEEKKNDLEKIVMKHFR